MDNFGRRTCGYIVPPVTGTYTFYIASDDQSRLFFSTDTTPVNTNPALSNQIAEVPDPAGGGNGWTNVDEWNKYSEQASAPISLTTGQYYYVEALQKEGAANDVLVPLITEAKKAKRCQKRRRRSAGQPPRHPLSKGSDRKYKEFKIIAFYDAAHEHQYVAGTSGNHHRLGRLMRQYGRMLAIDKAQVKYSVTDGAEWIRRQYVCQLPMLDAQVLDYYHLREHVIGAGETLYGVGSEMSIPWRKERYWGA